jgi:hypothetical protein
MLDLKLQFDIARRAYPGTRRGLDSEWAVFVRHKDYQKVLPLLYDAINKQIKWRQWLKNRKDFVPCWKNFQTWLRQRDWEVELPEFDAVQQRAITINHRPAFAKTKSQTMTKQGATLSSILEQRKLE